MPLFVVITIQLVFCVRFVISKMVLNAKNTRKYLRQDVTNTKATDNVTLTVAVRLKWN
jgi:hypothetical protein